MSCVESLESLRASVDRSMRLEGKADETLVLYANPSPTSARGGPARATGRPVSTATPSWRGSTSLVTAGRQPWRPLRIAAPEARRLDVRSVEAKQLGQAVGFLAERP